MFRRWAVTCSTGFFSNGNKCWDSGGGGLQKVINAGIRDLREWFLLSFAVFRSWAAACNQTLFGGKKKVFGFWWRWGAKGV